MATVEKIYKFDVHNNAVNPDCFEHLLESSNGNFYYKLDMVLKVAKTKKGYVCGFVLRYKTTSGVDWSDSPCYYYLIAYSSPKRAIIAALIDIIKFLSLEAYPVCVMVMVGNLFVEYCEAELPCDAKIG